MNLQKWQIGDVEIFQVLEVDNVGSAIQAAIPAATIENIQKIPWLVPNFADENGVLQSSNQSFIIKSQGNIIVVDTADGEGKIRSDLPEWSDFHTDYMKNFLATGVSLEDVTHVISTHLHTDHEGFNTLSQNGKFVPTFPNAKYLIVREDYGYWSSKPEKEMAADKEALDDSIKPIVDAGMSEFITSNHTFDRNVYLIPLPGHTPGHVGVVVESNGEKAIFSGDAIHHPCQIAHPEWGMLADVDPEEALKSRENLLTEIADTNTLLFGTHFANPVAGRVIRSGEGFIFQI